MGFKAKVQTAVNNARKLADGAAVLKNQNLADVLGGAAAKLEQALQHPDIDRVDLDEDQRDLPLEADPNLNSGGNEVFAAGDPGLKLQQEEAARRAAFATTADGQPKFDPETGNFAPINPAPSGMPFPGADPYGVTK